jgi:hypothetical protein
MFQLHPETVIGGGHMINQSLKRVHFFLQDNIVMMKIPIHSFSFCQLLKQLRIFLLQFLNNWGVIRCLKRRRLGFLDGCKRYINFRIWCRHLGGRSKNVFVRDTSCNRCIFDLFIGLRILCRNYFESFMGC